MILFTILGWMLAAISLLGEAFIFFLCFGEANLGFWPFVILTCVWVFISWLAFLILAFIAGLFGVLVEEYGEEKVIGGAITVLLFGLFLGR